MPIKNKKDLQNPKKRFDIAVKNSHQEATAAEKDVLDFVFEQARADVKKIKQVDPQISVKGLLQQHLFQHSESVYQQSQATLQHVNQWCGQPDMNKLHEIQKQASKQLSQAEFQEVIRLIGQCQDDAAREEKQVYPKFFDECRSCLITVYQETSSEV